MKRIFAFLFALSLLFTAPANASHLMGGEITWKCLGSGQFEFYLKLYRDCNSTVGITNPEIVIHNYPNVGAPIMPIDFMLISQSDNSPECNSSGSPVTCSGAGGNTPGAIEAFLYRSNPVLLDGVPPPEGWVITYDNCCRNIAITNLLDPQNRGFTLRAKMFAYDGQNTSNCFDSSPEFAEPPTPINCVGSEVNDFNHAWDIDGDSIAFSWAHSLDDLFGNYSEGSNPPYLPYNPGYNFDNPLPDQTENPQNGVVILNSTTSEIQFQSFTQGQFVYVLKVESWRQGLLISEVYREFQLTLVNGCQSFNTAPELEVDLPGTGSFITDTIYAGTVIGFSVASTATDSTISGTPHTISIDAAGMQFGSSFTDSLNGCPYPPCATLNPPAPISGNSPGATYFEWQTDFSHLNQDSSALYTPETYYFWFRSDNGVCPYPNSTEKLVAITVDVDTNLISMTPQITCVSADTAIGSVYLQWTPVSSTSGSFIAYKIFHSSNPQGTFNHIATITDINQSSYVDGNAFLNQANYYKVRLVSEYNSQLVSLPSQIQGNLYLEEDTTAWDLVWNPVHAEQQTDCNFGIWQMQTGGNWELLDTTFSHSYSNPEIDSLLQYDMPCGEEVLYKVNCMNDTCAESNVISFSFDEQPVAEISYSNHGNGNVHFSTAPNSTGIPTWDLGDLTSSGSGNFTHTYPDTGTYLVTLITTNTCGSDTDTVYIDVFPNVSINEPGTDDIFEIFPNPTKDLLHLKFNNTSTRPKSLQIIDINGKMVKAIDVSGKQKAFTVELSGLSAGTYFVQFQLNGQHHSNKFLKE